MGAVAAVNDVQHSVTGVRVDHPGEDHELYGVQHDRPVGLGRRLAV